jgi:hypothetical protein
VAGAFASAALAAGSNLGGLHAPELRTKLIVIGLAVICVGSRMSGHHLEPGRRAAYHRLTTSTESHSPGQDAQPPRPSNNLMTMPLYGAATPGCLVDNHSRTGRGYCSSRGARAAPTPHRAQGGRLGAQRRRHLPGHRADPVKSSALTVIRLSDDAVDVRRGIVKLVDPISSMMTGSGRWRECVRFR